MSQAEKVNKARKKRRTQKGVANPAVGSQGSSYPQAILHAIGTHPHLAELSHHLRADTAHRAGFGRFYQQKLAKGMDMGLDPGGAKHRLEFT